MASTLKNLALALLNATLILLALCLFLGWKLASEISGITASFAENLQIVTPLRENVGEVRSEVAGLRSELADLKRQSGEIVPDVLDRIDARVTALDARIGAMQSGVTDLIETPEKLIDHAIETGADAMVRGVADLRGCTLPS